MGMLRILQYFVLIVVLVILGIEFDLEYCGIGGISPLPDL
jgi:hypothetical protein